MHVFCGKRRNPNNIQNQDFPTNISENSRAKLIHVNPFRCLGCESWLRKQSHTHHGAGSTYEIQHGGGSLSLFFCFFFTNRNLHYGFGLKQWSVVSRIVAVEGNPHQPILCFKKPTVKLCVITKPRIRMRERFASWSHGERALRGKATTCLEKTTSMCCRPSGMCLISCTFVIVGQFFGCQKT